MIFKDKKKEQHFIKYGYCTMPLLSADEISLLTDLYNDTREESASGSFHTTHFSTNYPHKKRVHETIKQITGKNIGRVLPTFRIIFSNFMIKEGGGNNPMPMHADWTYVNEKDHTSIAIWLPLIDTGKENGCIGVIPFSQHISPDIRGPQILQWAPPVADILIDKMGELLPLPAGHALIYNHRLLHYSPPNNSETARPAINISLVPRGAEVFHYTMPQGTEQIHEFVADDDDFFLSYNNFQMPEKGKLIALHPLSSATLINCRVPKFVTQYAKNSWKQRIKKAVENTFS